jgi:hypothetical protein
MLLPVGFKFVNVSVMKCLLLAKRAGRRKSKDLEEGEHFIKTVSGTRVVAK